MSTQTYTDAVRIRVEPELRPRLEQMAKAEHLRLSEFVRRELRRVAARPQPKPQREGARHA